MGYDINKTDGTALTTIADGNIDTTATDLTLIGKNASIYGEYLNENFVKLLENFASPDEPSHPINGQLWFDTSQKRLKVYVSPEDLNIKPNPQSLGYFKSTSGTIVSDTQPFNMTAGDIWIDTTNNRLYFYDGESTILVGPKPTDTHETGFYVEEVAGADTLSHTLVKIYILGELVGFFSIDAFTVAEAIPGYSLPTVAPGFNPSDIEGFKFNGTATSAESLLDSLGNVYTVDDFLTTATDITINGTVTITDDNPLVLGSVQSNNVNSSSSTFSIVSNYAGQEVSLVLKNGSGLTPGLYLKPAAGTDPRKAGIFTDSPTTNFDVNGDSLITGALEVGDSLTVGNGIAVTGDVTVTGSVTLNEILFNGTGPINLSSNNDLTFEAVGDVIIQTASSSGLITLSSLTTLPSKTSSQLASYISPGTPAGTLAYQSNSSIGPVWFDGTNWNLFSLPSQSTNANKLLTTNGTTASWTNALSVYSGTFEYSIDSPNINSNDGPMTIYSAYSLDIQTSNLPIHISVGSGVDGPGSPVTIQAGQGGEPGGTSSVGGALYLFAGPAGFDLVGNPDGGSAYLQGGAAVDQGGHVYIEGGAASTVGDVVIQGLAYPKVDGSAGQFITTNGSGTLSWSTPASSSAPLTASSSGTPGQIAYDSNWIYICVASNTWKRASLGTW